MDAGGGPTRAAAAAFDSNAALPFSRSAAAAAAERRIFHHPTSEVPRGTSTAAYWSGGDCSSSDDRLDDDDDDEDDPDDGDGFVSAEEVNNNNKQNNNINNNRNNSSGSMQSSSEKFHHGETATSHDHQQVHHAVFGIGRGVAASTSKNGTGEQYQQVRSGDYENAVTVVESDQYYAAVPHGGDGMAVGRKGVDVENRSVFGGSRDAGLLVDSGDSVRTHLSDPITGNLMDDAMILPCGHSFGSDGMQQVYRLRACCKCTQPITEESVRPNLALRAAVQAFRREEESLSCKASKRKRDRFEQDKNGYEEPCPVEFSRGKGVQFPFSVSDRVMIKGNKRTPERFVGRMAVVTTQCLNGWYVVKTLDNAESVKLQYRSLAKVTNDPPGMVAWNKAITPSWL